MDETKLNDLLFEIRKLVETFREAGRTGATGSTRDAEGQKITTAFDRSTERLVRALAQLGTSIKSESRGRIQRDREIDDFVAAVDRATDAAEAQNQAAADRVRAEQQAAAAAQQRAAVDQEVAERSAWTQKQRDDYDRRMTEAAAKLRFSSAQDAAREELYNMGRERNFAQELAEAKLREFRASFTMEKALGSTGDFLSQKFGTNLVKTHMALTVFSGVVGSAESALGGLGKSMLSLAGATATGFDNFNQFNQVVDTVANGLSKMGASMPFLGAAVILVAEGAKFMLAQLQRVSDSFNAIAQVGGLTADGMDGVNRQFLRSGLTLEGYTKQVTSNSQALARLGGSVGEGAEQFSRLTGDLIDGDIGLQLRSIGFSSEQIADTAAGFITQQARLGRAQRMTQDQLTAGTIRYSRELDQISKLTGMQRTELQKRMDAALSEQRFRAKMDELSAKGQGELATQLNLFQSAVSESAPGLAEGLRDIIAAGGAVTTDAARKAFTLTGGQIVGIAQRALRGEDIGTSLQGLAGVVDQGAKRFNKLAQVADLEPVIGNLPQASDFASKGLNDFAKTLDRIRTDQEAGMTATTELTHSVVKTQQEMEQFSRSINAFSIALMPNAADIVESFATTMNKATQKIAKEMGIELPTIGAPGSTAAGQDGGSGGSGGSALATAGVGAAMYGGAKLGMTLASPTMNPLVIGAAGAVGAIAAGTAAYLGINKMTGGSAGKSPDEGPETKPGPGESPTSADARAQRGEKRPPGIYGDELVTPYRTMKVDQLIDFRGGQSGNKANFDRLDPNFRERLIAMALDYQQISAGRRMPFVSGHRTPEQNAAVGGANDSLHLQGLAADLGSDTVKLLQSRGVLGRFGFRVGDYPGSTGSHIYRRGGIARGPDSGYSATLHGVEAVVPLPDGRNIPVTMDQRFQEQMARIVGEMNSINAVNFNDIARRSETSMRSLDGMMANMIPNITDLVEQVRDGDTASAIGSIARAAPQDTQARQMIQDLGRSIETVARRQADLDLHHNNLLERLVDLQSRTATASERLLRTRQA